MYYGTFCGLIIILFIWFVFFNVRIIIIHDAATLLDLLSIAEKNVCGLVALTLKSVLLRKVPQLDSKIDELFSQNNIV